MFRRYRQRRGPYGMAAPSVMPSVIRSVILLALLIFILYILARWVLWLFGGGDQLQRASVLMHVEQGTMVNVSLEGGLMQRAEDSLKLYAGDKVATGGNGHALLTFFDESHLRMDVQSELMINESTRGSDESEFALTLLKGSLWLQTPDVATSSGTVTRTITLPRYSISVPNDAEIIVEEGTLLVFSADGAGVEMQLKNNASPVMVGEGQQLVLPAGEFTGDPIDLRSAIEPLAMQRTFIEESRGLNITEDSGSSAPSDDDVLTIITPADKALITTATVKVQGSVGPRVQRVRVNGYQSTINLQAHTFEQELSIKEGVDTTLTIEALDGRGIVLARETRTVRRGTQALPPPVISSPAKGGEIYRTQKTEFAISGTVPAGVQGVMVNDYKLQLFRPGDTTWSYLASTALNNLKAGSNAYDVYTLDAAGNKSEPVRITILLEAGTEGVVGTSSTPSGGSTSSQAIIDESQLPNNTPLLPGSLAVTGPTPGTTHTATGSEFLLEGTTPQATESVWVNGYKLQLYKPGNAYWNYIAKAEFNTLKPGRNVYKVTARNDKGEILDTLEYTATYNP